MADFCQSPPLSLLHNSQVAYVKHQQLKDKFTVEKQVYPRDFFSVMYFKFEYSSLT